MNSQNTESAQKEHTHSHANVAAGPVNADMNIGEVVARWPETAEIMTGYGLHCVGCHVNPYESIRAGAMGHGMSEETVDSMVKEMNETLEGTEEKDINLSDSAVKKFAELMDKEGKAGWGLKFTVEPGGCSGYTYAMDFAQKPLETERIVTEKGMKVFVSKDVFNMVRGVRIDYQDGLNGAGFKISNPNASHSCGCGKSFH
ncbi:MAG: iron-sulfur cluster assembly accessory protein [archaeon]|nr:iron-sulfur cluster assembly accessory protein [archaeon]